MSCFIPKRKTANGVEDIKLPITAVNGLSDKLSDLNNQTLSMPRIRFVNAIDTNNTMEISKSNPLTITVEIIDGYLQVGDQIQICTRELYTYRTLNKRKYKLRSQWNTHITTENVNSRFISVVIPAEVDYSRLFRTNTKNALTLSPLYIRVRRPIYINNADNDASFSNIVTVWKKYDRQNGKVQIK